MARRIIFLLCFILIAHHLYGQDGDSPQPAAGGKSFGLFENDEIMEITLRFDLTTYLRKKPKDFFLKTELVFHPGKDDSLSRNIRLKTRGEFRHRECAFAPIELNLKKVDFGYSDLDSIGKLKLVTQCGSGVTDENYILREYLVYKLFSVLSDTSFRVRLLRVNYIDTEKRRKPMYQYGFFIEPVELLAARTKMVQVKSSILNQKHIIPAIMDRLSIFNYMIGNFDWSIPGQHNVKVFKPADPYKGEYGIAIPYDFDWSGVVNASYAIPAEVVGTSSVRERIFLGVCRRRETFYKDLDEFVENEKNFIDAINNFPYLKQRDKTDILVFLDQFFDQVRGNRNNIVSFLQNSCKNF